MNWEQLALNPDFQDLYLETEDNPLTARIRALEADLVNLDITDPIKSMRVKAELHGIKFVQRVVNEKAKARLSPPSLAPVTNIQQTISSPPPSRLERWGLRGRVGA